MTGLKVDCRAELATSLGLLLHLVADDEGKDLEVDHCDQEGHVNNVLVSQPKTKKDR